MPRIERDRNQAARAATARRGGAERGALSGLAGIDHLDGETMRVLAGADPADRQADRQGGAETVRRPVLGPRIGGRP